MAESAKGGLRGFVVSASRLALSLSIAFVALGAVCAVGYWAYTYSERQAAKRAEDVRFWSKDLSSHLQMKATARTKLIDGVMHAAIEFDGYPEFLKHPANRSRGFHVSWDDSDGFTHVKKSLPLIEFTTTVNEKGEPIGNRVQFTELVSVRAYASLARLNVDWTFDVNVAKSAPPKPEFASADVASDHCAPGLSRQERLRRLARHGQVRETGIDSFSVGHRSVSFLSGSEVLSCR
jgi:hypothetical protein